MERAPSRGDRPLFMWYVFQRAVDDVCRCQAVQVADTATDQTLKNEDVPLYCQRGTTDGVEIKRRDRVALLDADEIRRSVHARRYRVIVECVRRCDSGGLVRPNDKRSQLDKYCDDCVRPAYGGRAAFRNGDEGGIVTGNSDV